MHTLIPIVDKVVLEKFEDGKEHWVSTTKMPLIDINSDVVGVWGISKIVTELKNAEIEAQEKASESKTLKNKLFRQQGEYQAIVKAVDASTYLVEYNIDGFITRTNEAMLSLMEKSTAQVLGKHHSEFFKTKFDDDDSYKEFWNELHQGIIKQRVFKGKLGSKSVMLNETYSPVKDVDGKVEKIIVIAVKE